MDLHSKEIFLFRNVQFYETQFPFSQLTHLVPPCQLNDTSHIEYLSYEPPSTSYNPLTSQSIPLRKSTRLTRPPSLARLPL